MILIKKIADVAVCGTIEANGQNNVEKGLM
jgi:hypothetical protein